MDNIINIFEYISKMIYNGLSFIIPIILSYSYLLIKFIFDALIAMIIFIFVIITTFIVPIIFVCLDFIVNYTYDNTSIVMNMCLISYIIHNKFYNDSDEIIYDMCKKIKKMYNKFCKLSIEIYKQIIKLFCRLHWNIRIMFKKNTHKVNIDPQNKLNNTNTNTYTLTCIVCLDKERTFMFSNCKHFCVCAECADIISMCPMCRTISETVKIFLS